MKGFCLLNDFSESTRAKTVKNLNCRATVAQKIVPLKKILSLAINWNDNRTV